MQITWLQIKPFFFFLNLKLHFVTQKAALKQQYVTLYVKLGQQLLRPEITGAKITPMLKALQKSGNLSSQDCKSIHPERCKETQHNL